MSTELNRTRQLLTDNFISALNEEKLPWQKPWVMSAPGFGMHHNPVTKTRYSGINALSLWATAIDKGYGDPRWCTFNQAKEKGWTVKKGEHGVPIEFWSMYDRKEKKKYSSIEAQNIINNNPEKAKDIFACSSTYTVFNGSQLDGIEPFPLAEIPSPDYTNTLLSDFVDAYLKNENIPLTQNSSQAYYSPGEDLISMPPKENFIGELDYYDTLLHECAHSTGYSSRLNRTLTGKANKKEYALEELRAEIAGAFLLSSTRAEIPMTISNNNKAYVQSWAEVIKDDPNALFKAIKDANTICNFVAERGNLEYFLSAGATEQTSDFIAELDNYISGKANSFNALKVCDTPAILQSLGLQPLPMLITQHHLQDILHPKGKENPHWHGITLEQMKSLPELLREPAIILNSLSKKDSIVAVLNELDEDKLPLVVSIVPDGSGVYELRRIDSNFITSIYGKDHFANAENGKESFLTLAVAEQSLLYVNKKQSSALFHKIGLPYPQYLAEFSYAAQKKNQDPQSYSELQLPQANAVFGSNNSIRQNDEKINTQAQKSKSSSLRASFFEDPSNTKKGYDLQEIKAIPITKIAEDMGFTVVKKGNGKKSIKEHDSVVIYSSTNTYYRWSDGKGGSSIDFVVNLCDLSTKDAINYLSETYLNQKGVFFSTPREQWIAEPKAEKEPKEFILPQKANGKYTHLFAYLIKTRGINLRVVTDLVKRGLIYEDERKNVVFVGLDEENNPGYAEKRGSGKDSDFKHEVESSRHDLGFFVDNHSCKLYLSEGHINSLSIMSLMSKGWQNASYLSTGGACKEEALFARLRNHPYITELCLCNDNDAAGRLANERIQKKIESEFPYIKLIIAVPKCNDFNDQLLNLRNTHFEDKPNKEKIDNEQEI